LANLLLLAPRALVTPGILAEACNHLESANNVFEWKIFGALKSLMGTLYEHHEPAIQLSENVFFLKFGFTDSSIADLAARNCLILSDDLRLTTTLQRRRFAAINFNHLRSAGWIR
jgi:hypothetical protein